MEETPITQEISVDGRLIYLINRDTGDIQYLQNSTPWTARDFSRARNLISRRHPTPLSLWLSLKEVAENRI